MCDGSLEIRPTETSMKGQKYIGWALVVGLYCGFVATFAFAEESVFNESDALARLAALFSGFEKVPKPVEIERVLGDRSDLLALLARDDQRKPVVRLRAIEAMALFPHDISREYLVDILQSSKSSAGLRRAAVRVLVRIAPERAVPVLEAVLKDSNVYLRERALHGLSEIGTSKARSLLSAQLQNETNPHLQAVIRAALKAPPKDEVKKDRIGPLEKSVDSERFSIDQEQKE